MRCEIPQSTSLYSKSFTPFPTSGLKRNGAVRSPPSDNGFSSPAPKTKTDFTAHAMSPSAVLALCAQLYGKTPPAYMPEIGGVSFELREGLTDEGAENMAAAGEC